MKTAGTYRHVINARLEFQNKAAYGFVCLTGLLTRLYFSKYTLSQFCIILCHHKSSDYINVNFSFNLSGFLDDGTASLKAIFTDAFMNHLTGSTCEQFVLRDGHDHRKELPTPLHQHKTKIYKLCIEMTRKSGPKKINFVVTDLLPNHISTAPLKIMNTPQKDTSITTSTPTIATLTPPPATPKTVSPQKTAPPPIERAESGQSSAAKRLKYDDKGKVLETNSFLLTITNKKNGHCR